MWGNVPKRIRDRLSPLMIRNLNLPGRYADGGNLVLNVAASASEVGHVTKSWLFRYRDRRDGRVREIGLGSLDDVPLKKAREDADKLRLVLREGRDPGDEKKQARTDAKLAKAKLMTFGQCAEKYIEAHESTWRNAKHRAQWRSTLDTYAADLLPLPVQDVSTALVVKALQEIWKTKTETASRVRQRIEAVLDWATAREFRFGDNPARLRGHLDVLLPEKSKVSKVTHQAAMAYTDLPAFMALLRARVGFSARLLELVILCVTRVGEAAAARWSEFDLDGGVWTIPPERMKANREHRVVLSKPALKMLGELPKKGAFLFPGQRGRTHMNPESARKLLQTDMGFTELTVHGFRSSFRDWAAERTSFTSDVIEMALAHAIKSKVEAAYRRGDLLAKRRQLMEAWSGFLAVVPASGANVTNLKKSPHIAG